jgi:hypothetical protein
VSSQAVLAGLSRGLLFLAVSRNNTCDAAAERLLLGLLDRGRRRLRLVGVVSRIKTGRQLGLLLLVALRHLVEMGAQSVGTRVPGWVRLLRLLLLLVLALALGQLLAVCGLVSLRAVVVHRERWSVSRTYTYGEVHMDWMPNRSLDSPEGFGDDWPELVTSTDWCERFDFLENIDGIAVAGFVAARSSSGDAAGCDCDQQAATSNGLNGTGGTKTTSRIVGRAPSSNIIHGAPLLLRACIPPSAQAARAGGAEQIE